MKVILEAQKAVGQPHIRGIGRYTIDTIEMLLSRKTFDYELTFFDYNREVGNHVRAEQYFGKYGVPMRECNELDYRVASRDESVFARRSYNSYTNTDGDIYHFMAPVTIPTNLKGKMIVTIHDVLWEHETSLMPDLPRELHKIAAERINRMKPFILAISETTRADILKYMDIPEENIQVIYNPYDEECMYPDRSDVSSIVEGDYFFFVGVLERRKNIISIIEAFNRIADSYSDIKLVISGKKDLDPYCYELYRAAEASPYKDRIIFTGYIDTQTKRRLYSNAKCFVFPSLLEGFGLPVVEAMACGCPVITANNTSLPEVGGDAVRYVNALDVEQLAHEMEGILTDDSLRNDLIQKGFAQKEKFSRDRIAEQVENFYRKVMER